MLADAAALDLEPVQAEMCATTQETRSSPQRVLRPFTLCVVHLPPLSKDQIGNCPRWWSPRPRQQSGSRRSEGRGARGEKVYIVMKELNIPLRV